MKYAMALEGLQQALASRYELGERRAIAQMVLEYVCQQSSLQPHRTLTAEAIALLATYTAQLVSGKPVQQVLGHAWFFGLQLEVNEAVLLPRPETEQLAHHVFKVYKDAPAHTFLDVGTGSGCISVALSHHLKKGNFVAVDISPAALQVARRNAQLYECGIHFFALDFLDEHQWAQIPVPDVLISNPPYIPQHEAESLEPHVRDHEPHVALFVPDEHALLFYEKIASFAAQNMQQGARLFLELHAPLAREAQEIFQQKNFQIAQIEKDWYGRDRFLWITL